MNTCDHIAHRMAAGERLNADQLGHVELCTACSASMEATQTLAAIGHARADITPGPGFSSRMASRASERIGQRKRHRIMGYAAATSGALAAAALTLALWNDNGPAEHASQAPLPAAMQPFIDDAPDLSDVDDDDARTARDLVWLTDADRALTQSANWEFIEEPVSPYALLLDESALEENE